MEIGRLDGKLVIVALFPQVGAIFPAKIIKEFKPCLN
jgi:hypothetical protein